MEGRWGVFNDIYCTKESTFTFMQNILDEVVELFPSSYIHLGGDEAPRIRWKNCVHCQERMKQEHLTRTISMLKERKLSVGMKYWKEAFRNVLL